MDTSKTTGIYQLVDRETGEPRGFRSYSKGWRRAPRADAAEALPSANPGEAARYPVDAAAPAAIKEDNPQAPPPAADVEPIPHYQRAPDPHAERPLPWGLRFGLDDQLPVHNSDRSPMWALAERSSRLAQGRPEAWPYPWRLR
jgi:hypothetical protein